MKKSLSSLLLISLAFILLIGDSLFYAFVLKEQPSNLSYLIRLNVVAIIIVYVVNFFIGLLKDPINETRDILN